jgi:large subunit ribosomal protein L19
VNIVDQIANAQMKSKDKVPQFSIGDTVRVHFRIVEGEKERVQVFEGVVIGRSGGEGPQARFTVRRVAYSEGVERVFPIHSPRLEKVEVVRPGSVRRAKLNYLRERSGKAARVKALGKSDKVAAAAPAADTAPAEPEAPAETGPEPAEVTPMETETAETAAAASEESQEKE